MTKLKKMDQRHDCLVNDPPGAHVPTTRLYNILDSQQKGHSATDHTLG